MKTTAAILLAVALSALMLTGCSVAMALSGHPEPNFDAFEVGATRKQVEVQLGLIKACVPMFGAILRDAQYAFLLVVVAHKVRLNVEDELPLERLCPLGGLRWIRGLSF